MPASSHSATDAGRPRRQSGQSAVELTVALPAMLTLLFGMVNIGTLVADKVVAAYAARQGARLAAQLGNGIASGLTTLSIDQGVCQTVKASAANLAYATVTEVDIYDAEDSGTANLDGSFIQPAGAKALYDSYDSNCSQLHASFQATTDGTPGGTPVRTQVPPDEAWIGLNVTWRYTVPIGYTSFGRPNQTRSFSLTTNDYAVMLAAPVLG